jgi:hypothetical protein
MPTTYAIPNGSTAFAATTYTGNGTSQTLNNAVNGTSFQPDLVWTKSRSNTNQHGLIDSVRGVSRWVGSNSTQAEDYTAGAYVTSFNSNGFSVGFGGVSNENGVSYVGWQWKANGAAVTNTAGSITSQVSANTAAGFSIVTWTGTGANATVGHGLGAVPRMMILANRGTTHDTIVYHASLPSASYRIYLNLTDAQDAGAATSFNSLAPTSSVINLGSNLYTNGSGYQMVAYCFAAVPGYSAFGSYTGNGSSDGPFCYTGFRPRFVLVKCSSNSTASTVWTIWDTSRSPYNASVNELLANSSAAEVVDSNGIDILSNGFKPKRNSEYANLSGWTYIYAAFAECPLKYSNAR